MTNMTNLKQKLTRSSALRVVATAATEFWLPGALAIGLAIGGVSEKRLQTIQGYFFGFLMLAWFTGQIVRIKRDIERKDAAKITIDRLATMTEKLDTQLDAIVGHSTGGDSYAVVRPLVNGTTGDLTFCSHVEGRFPIRDVDVISQDLEVDPPYKTAIVDHVEVIWPGSFREQLKWEAKGREQGRFLIQLSAFNHSVSCEAVVERGPGGVFMVAYRQRVNDRPWKYEIPSDFPDRDDSAPDRLFRHELPDGLWPRDTSAWNR